MISGHKGVSWSLHPIMRSVALERILVSGGERWTEPVAVKLPAPLHDKVIRDARVFTGLDDGELLAAVTEQLHEDHASRERRLLEQVRVAGLSQAGALGLSQVVAALNAGRAAHLVYDPEVRYTGSVGADGALYADEEVGAGNEAAETLRLCRCGDTGAEPARH